MIIGICGHKLEGKDTAYLLLKEAYGDRYTFHNLKFATKIKQLCTLLFGWTAEQMEDQSWKETIDPEWGFSFRQMAEWIGTKVLRNDICEQFPEYGKLIGKGLWVKSTIKEALKLDNDNTIICITDVRAPNEAEAINKCGGEVIRLFRTGLSINNDSEIERAVNTVEVDYGCVNNGIYLKPFQDDLIEVFEKILEDRK